MSNGDERLMADLAKLQAEHTAAYQNALALMTAFVEADGTPTPQQFRQILGDYEPETRTVMVEACRLAWQLFVPLSGMCSAMKGERLDPVDTWRSMLEHRAFHGAGDLLELFPECGPAS